VIVDGHVEVARHPGGERRRPCGALARVGRAVAVRVDLGEQAMGRQLGHVDDLTHRQAIGGRR
jgi:hypothetical protein